MAENKKKKKEGEEIPTELTTELLASIAKKYIDQKNFDYRVALKERLDAEEE